jgi:hypothetical protein
MRVEINCINKDPRQDQRVGGPNPTGGRWIVSLSEAVAGVESGKWQFYVRRGGHIVDVVVATSAHGHKYLRTVADRDTPDNLLSLPECR